MKLSISGRLHAQGLDTPRFDTAIDVVQYRALGRRRPAFGRFLEREPELQIAN